MTKNQIEETGMLTLDKDVHHKHKIVLRPQGVTSFSVSNESGDQTYFAIDLIHLNPTEKGMEILRLIGN